MDTIAALLVVESDSLRERFKEVLKRIPALTPVFAQAPCDQIHQWMSANPQILFVDYPACGDAGTQFAEQLKHQHPGLYILMGSAACSAKDAVAAMQAGAEDYLIDPFDAELIVTAFEKAVRTIASQHGATARPTTAQKTLVTQDPELNRILDIARKVAPSKATVMISGESGTGKEMLAKFIHANSNREKEPYIAVNCAALPEQLAESELFGHEKGAFTGAISRKIGKFESAGKGTLVLDEITEMPLPLQAKLLRALQEREIVRIGSNQTVQVAARVIAISNRNMKQAVASGAFREDLYYRLSVIPLTIPPLRERKSDILLLSKHFLDRFSKENNFRMQQISKAALECLSSQKWPGNVRELENTIERGVLIGSGETLLPEHLILDTAIAPTADKPALAAGMTVREMEKELIYQTLDAVNDNRTHAAKMLGISIRTLRNKLNEYRDEMGAADDVVSP